MFLKAASLVKTHHPGAPKGLQGHPWRRSDSPFVRALRAATSSLPLGNQTASKCCAVRGHFHGNVSIPWHPLLCCHCAFLLQLGPSRHPATGSVSCGMGLRLEEVPSLPVGVPAMRQVFLLSTGRFLHNSALKHLPVFSAAPEEQHLAGWKICRAPGTPSTCSHPQLLVGGSKITRWGKRPGHTWGQSLQQPPARNPSAAPGAAGPGATLDSSLRSLGRAPMVLVCL